MVGETRNQLSSGNNYAGLEKGMRIEAILVRVNSYEFRHPINKTNNEVFSTPCAF